MNFIFGGCPPSAWYASTPAVRGWLYFQAPVHRYWISCEILVAITGSMHSARQPVSPPLQTAGF